MAGYDIGVATNFGNGNDEIADGSPLDSSSIIVAHHDATNQYPLATVLSKSGITTTAGATVNIDGTNTGFRISHGVAALTSSLAHYCFRKDGTPDTVFVRRMTVSGTTITLGNTLTLTTLSESMAIVPLTATKSLLVYSTSGNLLFARVLTDDGSDISEGAEQGVFDFPDNNQIICAETLTSTFVVVTYIAANDLWVTTLNISGDTVTDNNTTFVDNTGGSDVESFPTQVRNKQIVRLSNTKWVCSYFRDHTVDTNRIAALEDTGSISKGTPLEFNAADHIASIAPKNSSSFVALVRDPLRLITISESSLTLTNDADDENVPNSTSPSAGTPFGGHIGEVGSNYIIATWDSNTEAQGYSVISGPTITVSTLTLASSTAISVLRTQLMATLTLTASAEFITQNIIALNTLSLAGSPESLFIIPISLSTLTLVSSPQTLAIRLPPVGLDTLTLGSSPQALAVLPGAVAVVSASLTLAGSTPSIGVAAPGVVILDTLTISASPETLARVQTFIFNPTQISNLRNAKHEVTARLTIFSPPILWTGQVDGVHDRGTTIITYDSGSGSLTFVRDFLQLIVGTSPGADDVARLRIDDVSSMLLTTGSFVVDENAVVWLSGMHLSFEHLFPIERINPRIASGTLYKFFDVPYTDENGQDNTDPICVAGPDQVTELESGSHVFNIDLSDSYPTTGGVISSYGLSVAPTLGTTVVFNTGTGIGTVTVDQAGYWWAICSTTDSFGNTMERFVLLRAHDSTDTDFIEVTITGYSETWGGGVRMSVEARENITLADVPDNAIAYLWHENKFDGAEGYVNILENYDTILFNGYIRSDRSRSDLKTGDKSATFELTTVDGLMENLPLRSITVRLKSTPTDWWQYQLLTTGEAIWFLFRWHSTVPWRHDMIGIKTFDKFQRRLAADFEEGSLFRMANQVAFDRGVVAKITCDRLGRIHFVQDTQLLNQPQRDAIISAFDIHEGDVSGIIDIVREPEPRVHQMQISGFLYSTAGEGTPYIAIIPGYRPADTSFSMPERRGSSFRNIPNQLLQSQTEANQRVGRYFAQANMPIKEFRIPFRGNYLTALTTIPSYGWYDFNIQNTTLAREFDVNSIRLLCRSIQASIDSQSGMLQVTGVFEPEAHGPDGILGNYPTSLIEPTVEVLPAPEEVEFAAEALLVGQSAEYRRTYPEELEDTDWTQFDASSFNHVAIDPWWKIVNETEDPDNLIWIGAGSGTITLFNQALAVADIETDITPTNDPPNTWTDGVAPTVAALEFVEVLGDRFIQDRFYVLAEWQEAGGDWRTWVAITSDAGTSWIWLDFFDGYTLSGQAKARNLAVNGTYLMAVLCEAVSADSEGVGYLRVYTKSNLIGFSRTLVNAGTALLDWSALHSASVITVTDDDNLWFVYGSILGGPVTLLAIDHIIFTLDAGATWDVYENRWSSPTREKCIALRVGPINTAGFRKVWAIRS